MLANTWGQLAGPSVNEQITKCGISQDFLIHAPRLQQNLLAVSTTEQQCEVTDRGYRGPVGFGITFDNSWMTTPSAALEDRRGRPDQRESADVTVPPDNQDPLLL